MSWSLTDLEALSMGDLLNSDMRTTVLQNILFLEEFKVVCELCASLHIPMVALKGISFFGRIYTPAERSMTDVDILIHKKNLPKLRQALADIGFAERKEAKWSANDFKYVFVRHNLSLEIVLEVHTQLTASTSSEQWHYITRDNHFILSPQDELLYLSYHYATQHTLLKTKWLHDIFVITKHRPELWNGTLWDRAHQLAVTSSLHFTAQALKLAYMIDPFTPTSPKRWMASLLLNYDFLEDPTSHQWRYLITKHAVKENLWEALRYDLGWLCFAVKQRLHGQSEK